MTKRIKRIVKRSTDAAIVYLMDVPYVNRTPDMTPPTADTVAANPSIRRLGFTTGLGIAVFQNMIMRMNESDHRTDEYLSMVFDREFPRADVVVSHAGFPVKYWRNMRTQWNNGTHGVDEHGDARPATPLSRYDANGEPMAGRAPKPSA